MMVDFGPEYDYPDLPPPSSKPMLQGEGIVIEGAKTFIELLDTFNSYTGNALKILRVNAGATGIEAVTLVTDKNYVHNQPTPSDDWGTINHGLGKYPTIQIFNDSGEVAHANITHTDLNNVTITADVAFAGKAYFN